MNLVPTWKNAANRQILMIEAQSVLPVNPSGEVELTDADLEAIYGGNGSGILTDNLSDNNIDILGGPNTILNNVGILGVGSSSNSNQRADCHNQGHGGGHGGGYDNCHRRRC